MKKILLILGLLLLPQFALAQTPIAAMTVATCGSQNLKAGFTYGLTQDLTGTLCTAGGGSGGTSYTVNYGSAIGVKGTPGGFQDSSGNFQPFLGDTTNGLWVNVKAGGTGGGAVYGPTAVGSAAANPPVLSGGTADGTATGTVAVNVIKAGNTATTTDKAVIVADPNVLAAVNSPIPAGTNLIGKVGIDQTTPGTTNGVQVNAALPAGTNALGSVIGSSNQTPTDCSGSITAGGTAQNAFSAGSTKHGFTIVNIDTTEPLWISFTTTAAASGSGSYPLQAATATTFASPGSFTTPMGFGMNTALSVIAATTSHKFTCTWW